MRVVVQRVSCASVAIDSVEYSRIEKGLLVLLGVEHADTKEDADWLIKKIHQMRIFPDENGLMNRSLQDIGASLLIVSQFTLHASTKKGNRPSFIQAAPPATAVPLYEYFISTFNALAPGLVKTGSFGADMKVSLINDGPVTIVMDSKARE
jgi:D-aminoacyl-tRNA deacylase